MWMTILIVYLVIAVLVYLWGAIHDAYQHFVLKRYDPKFPFTPIHTHQFMAVIALAWFPLLVMCFWYAIKEGLERIST